MTQKTPKRSRGKRPAKRTKKKASALLGQSGGLAPDEYLGKVVALIKAARRFSPQNLWRTRQFFEANWDAPELSMLVRELPCSANLHILSGARRPEERAFDLRIAFDKRWNVWELAWKIASSAFERAVLSPLGLSTALREIHTEADLHGALLRNLGRFVTELGRDFCFVGSEYPVQVGHQDFAIDLVFFHHRCARGTTEALS